MNYKIILSVVFLLCFQSPGSAAPAYGTRLPGQNKIFGGFQFHQVIDRELESPRGSFSSSQYFALVSYGIFDWLSLDLKGGFGNADWQAQGFDELNLPGWLTGGYGLRLRLYETVDQKAKWVCGFQHISVHPRSHDIFSDPRGPRFKTVIDDWQFSLLGSYRIMDAVTLYGGGKWSRMDLITWTEGRRKRAKPEKVWGTVIGLDWDIMDRVWVNLEADLVDGEAFSASLNYAF